MMLYLYVVIGVTWATSAHAFQTLLSRARERLRVRSRCVLAFRLDAPTHPQQTGPDLIFASHAYINGAKSLLFLLS